MTEDEWKEKSHRIYKNIIAHPFFLRADTIYCYVSYHHEADTYAIIQKAWELGKQVAVPKVSGTSMEFYYIQSFHDLQKGYCNIPEPITDKLATIENALVLMPGAAFDKQRHRIGYGKGFYDKYLTLHPLHRTIAAAFELQIIDDIPAEPFDISPEIVITEEHIYV